MTLAIEPYRADVPDKVIADLRDRLARTRFPNQVADVGWDQGTELGYLQELVTYLAASSSTGVPSRPAFNTIGQFTTEVAGQRIHFLHARSRSRTRCR